jgi:hypothetical protein
MSEQEPEEESSDAQAAEATEANGSGRGMRSGTKYPYFDLEAAEKFAKGIQDSGGSEVLEEDLLKHMGVANTTKSWIYGLSTAKEFGFVERKGQKAEARIMLTDLAKRLLRPGDNDELMASRVAAFLNPPIYKKLFERYKGATVPRVEFLANLLVREHKLLESVATPAAQAFIASAKFAGLDTNNVLGDPKKVEKKADEKPPIGDVTPPDPPPGQRALNVPSDFNLYTFPLRRDLTVSIPLPSALTKKDVDRLHKWLDTLIFDDEATT